MSHNKFPSNLHILPIFKDVPIQMEGKRNVEGMRFKCYTYIGTVYHTSMENIIKGILKYILFKWKLNGF